MSFKYVPYYIQHLKAINISLQNTEGLESNYMEQPTNDYHDALQVVNPHWAPSSNIF